jgi:glucose-1-phosphate cytidylyltransferase
VRRARRPHGEGRQQIPKPMIAIGTQPILWHIMKSGPHRFHPLARRSCRDHQGLVPEVRRGTRQRLRVFERRTRRGAFRLGHLRLADHVRGYRRPVFDRRAPAACRPASRRRLVFLATYGHGVTDAPLDELIATLERSGKTGLFISVKPRPEYHVVLREPRRRSNRGRADCPGGCTDQRLVVRVPTGHRGDQPGEDVVEQPFAA